MVDRYIWVSNYKDVTESALNEHINEHWNTVHLKRLGFFTSLYLTSRLGIILATCLRAGTVWPILRRKWKTLFGSHVNTTGFQMPRKAQHRVQTHWDHFRTRDHFSLGGSNHSFLISEHHMFFLPSYIYHYILSIGGVIASGFILDAENLVATTTVKTNEQQIVQNRGLVEVCLRSVAM